MIKHGIDQDALITQFSTATAKQGEALREAVSAATLKALKGRELTLANIKQVLNTVAQSASQGAASNPIGVEQVEALLTKAIAGMDSALERAVQANHRALQQIVEQGASVSEKQIKKAMGDIDKMEEALFDAARKAATGVGAPLEAPWAGALKAMQLKGTGTGTQAQATLEQLLDQTQQGLRQGRELGLRATQAMLDGYSTLVSGVLIGMSEALESQGSASQASEAATEPAKSRRK